MIIFKAIFSLLLDRRFTSFIISFHASLLCQHKRRNKLLAAPTDPLKADRPAADMTHIKISFQVASLDLSEPSPPCSSALVNVCNAVSIRALNTSDESK